jgi:large subunit ribosomal protein L35Ae
MKQVSESVREGLVMNYRLGKKIQYPKECLIKVLGVTPSESKGMVGWKVSWPLVNPKITGKIVKIHGRKGTLIAKFSSGLPGQALNTRVKIHE